MLFVEAIEVDDAGPSSGLSSVSVRHNICVVENEEGSMKAARLKEAREGNALRGHYFGVVSWW